jgi:hypothetical protein
MILENQETGGSGRGQAQEARSQLAVGSWQKKQLSGHSEQKGWKGNEAKNLLVCWLA